MAQLPLVKMFYDGFVKSPDAALRCILRHCGVRQVRLIPQDWRALSANIFMKPSIMDNYLLFTGSRILAFLCFFLEVLLPLRYMQTTV